MDQFNLNSYSLSGEINKIYCVRQVAHFDVSSDALINSSTVLLLLCCYSILWSGEVKYVRFTFHNVILCNRKQFSCSRMGLI